MEKSKRRYQQSPQEQPHSSSSRRRYSRRISEKEQKKAFRVTLVGIGLILVLAAGVMIHQTVQLQQQKSEYTAQIEQLQEDIEEAEQRQEELLEKKAEVNSSEYIESEARKRLGLVYEDEILLKRQN